MQTARWADIYLTAMQAINAKEQSWVYVLILMAKTGAKQAIPIRIRVKS